MCCAERQFGRLVTTLPGGAGITLGHGGTGDHPAAAGWYELRTREIVVILGETSPAQQLQTLMHEVTHSILHGDGEHHATPTAEVEATRASSLWPQGNCPTGCWTQSVSGQASAKARMYMRFARENPFIAGNAARRSAAILSTSR
jgi:hypothetical protein